jgi:carbon storage regulator
MIVFRRKKRDQIMIGGDIIITVMHIRGSRVSLGIQAPEGVKILRNELAPHERNVSIPIAEGIEASASPLPVVS